MGMELEEPETRLEFCGVAAGMHERLNAAQELQTIALLNDLGATPEQISTFTAIKISKVLDVLNTLAITTVAKPWS